MSLRVTPGASSWCLAYGAWYFNGLQAMEQDDFVSPLFAEFLGMCFAVSPGYPVDFLPCTLDPRFEDDDGLRSLQRPLSTHVRIDDDLSPPTTFARAVEPPGCLGTGASSHMDSLARVEPFPVHSVVEPGVCSGPGCSEITVQSMKPGDSAWRVGCTVGRSCLKPLSSCAKVKAKKVSFAFAVDFWFPGPSQLTLQTKESHLSFWPESCAPPCSSGDAYCVPGAEFGAHQCSHCSSPAGFVSGSSVNPLLPSHGRVPALSGFVSVDSCTAYALPDRAGRQLAVSDIGATGPSGSAGGSTAAGSAAISESLPLQGSSPSDAASQDECVSHVASFGDAAQDGEISHPFTVFDEVHEFGTFESQSHWKKHDYIRAAIDFARLPGTPLARFLKFEVVSLPSPQVILTMDHGAIPHRAVVFDLRPYEGRICVLDVTPDATLLEALMTLHGRLAHVAAEIVFDGILGGTCVCHVNGRIVNAWATLPSTADLVQFYCLHGAQPWGAPADAHGEATQAGSVSHASAASASTLPPRAPAQSSQPSGASRPAVSAGVSTSGTDPSLPSFYTCFNFLEQRLLKRKEPGWTDEDCRQDALRSVWFAVPKAIILADPVEGYPLPQVLVFKITDLNEHIPVVLAFQGDRCEPLVTNIPRRASVATFLSGFRHGPGLPGHGVIDVPGGYTCFAKDVAISCFSPLPHEVHVVRIRRALSAEHPNQLHRQPPSQEPSHLVVPGTGGTETLAAAREDASATHLANEGGGIHTCLDSMIGPRFRERFDGWSPMQCLEDCELSALHLPSPVGRLLVFPVEGLPEPQTLVTNRMLLSSHHSFALDLRAVGQHVTAVTVPHGHMVFQALHAIGEDTQLALQTLGVEQLPLTFYVNGARVGPSTVIPAATDVVCVIPGGHIGDGYGPPDIAGAIWGSDSTTSTTFGPASTAAGSSASVVTPDGFLVSEEDGLVPASTWWKGVSRAVVDARIAQAKAAGLTGGPYTLFDELAGPIVLTRRPEWSRRQCVFHAVDTSQVPDPVGRLLNVPVPGWPEPQVLVSRAQLVLTHLAVVHLIAGEESDPKVQQVPQGASMTRLHFLCGRFPPTACWCNDAFLHCAEPIPLDTDFVRAVESDSVELLGVLSPGDLPPSHPLQPLYRSHFRAGGFIPRHGFPRLAEDERIETGVPPMPVDTTLQTVLSGPSDPSSTLGSSSSSSGGPVPAHMKFTVFDVFYHVRVLDVLLPATRLSILRAIRAHTPQLGPAYGHRVVCHPLAGFPEPQFVVWDEPCENFRVFPVMHPDVEQAVCTIKVPTSTTTFHIAYAVEQACGALPDYRFAVARQIAHISLDEISVPPFAQCDASRVDVASFGWGPPQTVGVAAARWSHPWPRFLPLSRPDQITDDPGSTLVTVHRLARSPVTCSVDPCLRFGRMCTSLSGEIGVVTGFYRLPQFCPAAPGLPLHLVLDDRFDRNSRSLAIIDLRRVRRSVDPDFITVVCPRKFGLDWLRQCLLAHGVDGSRVKEAYVDGERLREIVEPAWPAILISCVGPVPLLPGSGRILFPAIIDTRAIMSLRLGLAQSTLKWKHAKCSPPSARSVWTLAPATCSVLGPDPCVNFDPPSVLSLDCYPDPEDFELIVYCLHEDAFRTWVPRIASYDEVLGHLARVCGMTEVCAPWPRFAPCLPGGACHVAIVPTVMQDANYAIVDSRRVFPRDVRKALRLVLLPDRVAPVNLGDDLFRDEPPRLALGALALDGLLTHGPFRTRPGIHTITVFPAPAGWTACVCDNWRIVTSHVGCCLHLQTMTSTTTTMGSGDGSPWQLFTTSSTTTSVGLAANAVSPAAQHGADEAVRVVFALPGTRCRSVLWRVGQPLVQALLPLLTHFAQYLPWDTLPTLIAAHRFMRDECGRPVLLFTVEHPDFHLCCNVWVYVQDGTFCNYKLVALDKRTSAVSFRRTHCPAQMAWDLLLNGVRASDFPRWHDAALVVLTPDWTCSVTEPLAKLFTLSKDLHFVQFPLEIPDCLSRLAIPFCDTRRDFVRMWDNQLSRLAAFNGYLPEARYVTMALPDHGLCRLRLIHQLTPTASALRQLVHEVWPWLARAEVLDCHEVIDDGCLFMVQYPRALHAAWFCSVPDGTDLFFVPFAQHPCSCIPCPLGHLRVARHEGAFGFLQHRAGPPTHESVSRWHESAMDTWGRAERHSTSSDERRMFASPDAMHSDVSDIDMCSNVTADDAAEAVAIGDTSRSGVVTTAIRPTGADDTAAGLGFDEAATSLLQVRARRNWAKRPSDADALAAGVVQWCVWTISGPSWFAADKQATFCEVDRALRDGGFGFGVASLVPVSSGNFRLIAVPSVVMPQSVWALVQWPEKGDSLECLHVSDTVHSLSLRSGLGLLDFALNGIPWLGAAQGFFHGMHLLAAPRPLSTATCIRPIATPSRGNHQLPLLELSAAIPAFSPDSVQGLRLLLRSVMLPWLEGWTRDLSSLQLSPGLRSHFASAPTPALLPSAFWIFTDGSAGSCSAGCGLVLCVEHYVGSESLWTFLGWSGHVCPGGATNNEAESAAVLQAVTWALGVAWCLPVHVVADSRIATQSADGTCGIINTQCKASVHQQARAVVQVHQAGKSLLCFDWVPSHCGIAANELADAVAKHFARDPATPERLPDAVKAFWRHPLLPWAWTLFDGGCSIDLERLESGCYEPFDAVRPEHVAAVTSDVAPSTRLGISHSLRLLTANVCSLRDKHQFLICQLESCDVAVCALQETRAPGSSALAIDGWLRFGSAAERGHHGVAIWFRQAAFSCEGTLPTIEAIAVIQQQKDWLALRFQFGGFDAIFVTLHAPHSGHPPEVIRAWWHAASERLDALCAIAPLIVLGDANAVVSHASDPSIGGLAATEPDLAGELFASLLHRFGLVAANTFSSRAYPDFLCPTFGDKCIDYICVPGRWASCVEQVESRVDLGNVHDDHDPVEVILQLQHPQRAVRRGGKRNQAKRQRLNVSIPWSVDVHSHAELLFQQAKVACRRPSARCAQKPYVSEATLELLAQKRCARTLLKRYSVAGISGPALTEAVAAFRRLAAQVKDAVKDDKLAYLESVAGSIKDALDAREGQAVWHALRFFRPASGRVKKPFRSLPILLDVRGQPAQSFEGQQNIKAVFFAEMEAAVLAPTARERPRPDHCFELCEVPTLVEVEQCIRRMPKGKVPGPSGVRNECWQQDVLSSAKLWVELVAKMNCRGTEAFRLSAGTLHTLYKGKGDICEIANHRSIFLLEGIGKALRRLSRPALLDCATCRDVPLLYGAPPGSQAAFLSHYILTFQRLARGTGCSSSVLFVDVRSAYYRVLRQRLVGGKLDDQALCQILATMKVPSEALQAVLSWADGEPLVSQMSQHQQLMLEALFQNPCFLLRGIPQPYYSRCGTRPGDSLADAMFYVVFADCLAEMRVRLRGEGLLDGPGMSVVAQPTWADDLAVPIHGPAAEIAEKSRGMCRAVHETLGARALDVNYNAGKTELLTSWRGVGSRKHKQALLAKCDTLCFKAFGVEREVRLTLAYTHLGTKICETLSCTADVKFKAAKALANARPLAPRVLRCPDLDLVHRRRFLSSLGLSVLGYNVAVWHHFSVADQRAWAQAVDSLARLLVPDDRWSDSPLHPTVYEVCGATGVVEPLALLSQLRILHLVRLVSSSCDALWDLLVLEAEATSVSWLSELRADFAWLAYWAPCALVSKLPDLPFDELAVTLSSYAGRVRAAVKRAGQAQVASLHEWDVYQRRQRAHGSFHGVQWVRAHVSHPGSIACPECCLTFDSGSHLATHMAHAHRYISTARQYASGSRCRWCLKQYWTVARLREHLAAGSSCLALLVASLPPLDASQLADVDQLHVEQRRESKRLGGTASVDRFPPLQCCGPRLPMPSDLVACLSVELHGMSSFARASLWRSALAVQRLGFPELESVLDALEPMSLCRAQVAPPP